MNSAEIAVESFHTSPAWFAAWRSAYMPVAARAATIDRLALIDEDVGTTLFRYRRRRAQTSIQTARFDAPAHHRPADRLPDMLLADGTDLVVLDYLPDDSPLVAAARGWRHRVKIAPHARAPAADCRMRESEWFDRRTKRARQRWKRIERTVFDTLGMRFEVVEDGDLDALVDAMLAVEASGWKGRSGTAIAQNPADAAFYREIAHRAAAAGALRLALLRHHGRIVAFEFGVTGGDRIYLLKVGFDETFADQSIGHALAVMHIRHCCEDPAIDWYDKLGNGMTPASYKLRLADTVDTLYRITLYGDGWRGTVLLYAHRARRLAKRVRASFRRAATT